MQNTRVEMVGGVHGQVTIKLDEPKPTRSAFSPGKLPFTTALVHVCALSQAFWTVNCCMMQC